jgi:hypothetical protein
MGCAEPAEQALPQLPEGLRPLLACGLMERLDLRVPPAATISHHFNFPH